jgi:hypothetical protein
MVGLSAVLMIAGIAVLIFWTGWYTRHSQRKDRAEAATN